MTKEEVWKQLGELIAVGGEGQPLVFCSSLTQLSDGNKTTYRFEMCDPNCPDEKWKVTVSLEQV